MPALYLNFFGFGQGLPNTKKPPANPQDWRTPTRTVHSKNLGYHVGDETLAWTAGDGMR
jgi:hypothetical protein